MRPTGIITRMSCTRLWSQSSCSDWNRRIIWKIFDSSIYALKYPLGVPVVAQQKWTQLVSMRTGVWSLASLSGLRIQHCCGVGCRRGSDLALLWLRCRLAAVALIIPLAWEPPYALGVALKRKKKNPLNHQFCSECWDWVATNTWNVTKITFQCDNEKCHVKKYLPFR